MPRRPPVSDVEQTLPIDHDSISDQIAKEMPSILMDAGMARCLTPRPRTPRDSSMTIGSKAQRVTVPHQECVQQAKQQIHLLFTALGNYLEHVGIILAAYGSVERDASNGVKVMQPGTLGALQHALSSLIPGETQFGGDHSQSHGEAVAIDQRIPEVQSSVPLATGRNPSVKPTSSAGSAAHSESLADRKRMYSSTTSSTEVHQEFNAQQSEVQLFKIATMGMNAQQFTESPSYKTGGVDSASSPRRPECGKVATSSPTMDPGRSTFTPSTWKEFQRYTLVSSLGAPERLRQVGEAIGKEADSMLHMQTNASSMRKHSTVKESMYSQVFEVVVAVVISLNAIVLGVSSDIDWSGWHIVEYCFSAFFIVEMLCKMYVYGLGDYFFGVDWAWNAFDFMLVLMGILDNLVALVAARDDGDSTAGLLMMIKIVRICRLARLVRLLRLQLFKELNAMINGLFSGLRTLLWAIVLLFVLIFVLAVALRQLIETDDTRTNFRLKRGFRSIPTAMTTLFVCFFDGCTALDGTPIPVHFYDEFGMLFMSCYMLVVLFVTIGVLNLIMAIFIDNVLERGRQRKMQQRASDRSRMERRLRRVVRKFLSDYTGLVTNRSSAMLMSDQIASYAASLKRLGVQGFFHALWASWTGAPEEEPKRVDAPSDDSFVITREVFCDLLRDTDMLKVLALLDIETSTRDELFDVLDADMSGELDFEELIVGLMTLRGPAEKKDTVGCLLCIRATQFYLRQMQNRDQDQLKTLTAEVKKMQAILSTI